MTTQKKSTYVIEEKSRELPPIAIIGLAGILPEAENLDQYWENILHEVNCIREVPSSRWNVADYYDPDPSVPDKSYSKYGGFIPDIPFDPMEFGLPPNILEVTDVSQLLSLKVAKDALKDAGYTAESESILDRTGVILGMVGMGSKLVHPLLNRLQYPLWEKVLRASAVPEDEIPAIIEKMKLAYVAWNENAFPGTIGNVVAGRIANRLDLGGTNCVVDAACGSSLAAVSMAVSELVMGRADMMITGGVDTDNSILTYLCFSKTPAFSKGDRLRAFSADSDGMLAGEGIGMLVLKRLADAERDGNRIYAVIRGIGTSSDGHFKSIYAPRPAGQAKAVRRAYQNAGYDAASVTLVEAHGTGTIAGDPAEFEGLNAVFSENNPRRQYIALGSVKSQIGHTKATAGAASLIKTTLALHNKILPATINVSQPNEGMHIENTPFYLNTETRPWFRKAQAHPRRAGVSSFGFGGTNFHITLEEYSAEQNNAYRTRRVPYTILLSAPAGAELTQACRETLARLESPNAIAVLNELDQAAASAVIPQQHARLGFIADSAADAREKLQESIRLLTANQGQTSWSHPKGIFYRESGLDPRGKTVALFPGQGSQYLNMGRELALNFPTVRQTFELADEINASQGSAPLTDAVYPLPVFSDEERKRQADILTKTENAQPAIGAFSLALYKLLQAAGFNADFFAGHSFGELSALWAAGVYDEAAFLKLAKARGDAMSLPASSGKDTGSMVAVKGDVERVQELLKDNPEITIANFNSPTQVVLAGASEAVKAIQPKLEQPGLSVYPLQVSAAFHTAFVGHAQAPFKAAIQKEKFSTPKGKVYSNTSAQSYATDPLQIRAILADHILNPVRFKEEIENIYRDGGTIFIEIGPKNVLTNLVKDILKDQPHETITLNANTKGDSDAQFRQAVLQMRVLGFGLGNVDPFRQYTAPQQKQPSKVSVTLNGGLYLTDKTRADFEKALQAKPQRSSTVPAANPQPAAAQPPIPNPSLGNKVASMNVDNRQVASLMQQFQEHQKELIKTHELFLQNEQTSKKIIREIADAELSMLAKLNGSPHPPYVDQALSTIAKRAELVSEQQNQASLAHLEYIKSQTAFTQQLGTLIGALLGSNGQNNQQTLPIADVAIAQAAQEMAAVAVEPAPSVAAQPVQAVAAVPAPLQPSATVDSGQLTTAFLQIVSEKTGYPEDMLELSMDMEADLGIDSIKRVEILGAVQEQFPALPTISAEQLATLRTLQQIVAAFDSAPRSAPSAIAPAQTSAPAAVSGEPVAAAVAAYSQEELTSVFLSIVSEKTGYPADMLELGMDMEADLGIDSIKRVEILGAMQEQFPALPQISAEQLSTLRTLDQIIGAFQNTPASAAAPAAAAEVLPAVKTAPAETGAPNAPSSDPSELQAAFLKIVSEKTGYPADMLELGMDMEADLGIDSIKRVEILGAVQEQFPQLPAIAAEELVNLRTLAHIIDHFNNPQPANAVAEETAAVEAASVNETPASQSPIERFPARLESIPQPDYLNFELPKGSLVLITDDGSQRASLLAEAYLAAGQKVGLLQFDTLKSTGKRKIPEGAQRYLINTSDEDAIRAQMEAIFAENANLAAFIHLNAETKGESKGLLAISAQETANLKAVFLIARHLKKPLAAAGNSCRPAFLTVTRMDGNFGLNGNTAADPLPGGYAGLAKTLRQEWQGVFCRALDLHPDIDAPAAASIIQAELHDPDMRLAEVGYTPQGRFTLAI